LVKFHRLCLSILSELDIGTIVPHASTMEVPIEKDQFPSPCGELEESWRKQWRKRKNEL
jgi:hypothetical protein